MKGRGLGYRLLAEIIAHARRAGYAEVHGDVFSENTAMLGLAEELGFVLQPREAGEDTRRVRLIAAPRRASRQPEPADLHLTFADTDVASARCLVCSAAKAGHAVRR